MCAVIPVLNEEAHISQCIDSLLAQTMSVDILVLDGGSTDKTLEILSGYGKKITVVDNPGKRVAQARNLALELISDDVTHCLEIIGHSWVEKDHVELRINDMLELEKELGKPVGAIGTLTLAGNEDTKVASWIEGALATPIGSGGGQFKQFKGREKTKIPAFCIHRVEALRAVNGWDERFITSQDSDLSMRMLAAGWELWRSDVSHVRMHKRSSIRNWWRMCHRYGFWRTKVLFSHPQRADPREFLPIVGIALIFILDQWWWAPAAYLITLFLMGAVFYRKEHMSSIFGIPFALFILHTAFTLGLVDGLFRTGRAPKDRS